MGNVRMTFTTKEEVETALATYESVNGQFLRSGLARTINSFLMDHTNDGSPKDANAGYAQRLNGSANEKIGLAKSLSVMPGDMIVAEVYAKYMDPDNLNWGAALSSLMSQLTSQMPPSGLIVDGSGYANSGAIPLGVTPIGHGADPDGGVPKAYLNYMFFNKNYELVRTRVVRVTTAALEDGSDGPHEHLKIEEIVTEPGYVYVYLSNDEKTVREVYFDDFKIEHVKSPIVESQSFYPFGLTFDHFQRENSTGNRYLYNQGSGKKRFNTERIFDLDLNVDQSKYRSYDYITGRWW